jgi:hypothetical protein
MISPSSRSSPITRSISLARHPALLKLGEQGVAAGGGAIVGKESEEEFLVVRESGHGAGRCAVEG